MAKNKLKLSGAAVLLVIVVPLFMYAGALLIGIQLGRALERSPDSMSVSFSIRGALAYLAKVIFCLIHICIYVTAQLLYADRRLLLIIAVLSASLLQFLSFGIATIMFWDWEDEEAKQRRCGWRRGLSVLKAQIWSSQISIVAPISHSGAPRLHSVTLQHSPSGIHSLACQYSVSGGDSSRRFRMAAGPWGRPQSSTGSLLHATINLAAGEHVTAMEGTVGHFATVPGVIVTSLAFRTNTGRTYGPYGRTTAGTTPFSVPAADGACIVGFWGRSGWLLDAIGVYMKPCSSSSNPAYKAAMRRQG
ncbi:unnamed protein product [Urochloa decumbens]|uniref:Jacalin-type lectin domain-containing protein n=1 Tax=Urochloa decumbens TaxID=240449 RepID=A0ABC9GR93_9POAL